MNNSVLQTVVDLWKRGRKVKTAPTGWISGNAVCCDDKRGRGGLRPDPDGSWTWHCFNCQFKTGWAPGRFLSNKNKEFIRKLGANDDELIQLSMAAMRLKENIPLLNSKAHTIIQFPRHELYDKSITIMQALTEYPDNEDLIKVCKKILARDLDIERYYWSPKMPTRWIIPFTWNGVNVGWTARSVSRSTSPKYLSYVPNGYVYGLDHQKDDWKVMLVCEGVLDADIINGVAVLGNNVSKTQREYIERLDREIIWVADQDEAGLKAAERVLEWGWSVSLPKWQNCKDINEAVVRYGRAATVLSIITAATRNRVAATLQIKQIRNKLKNERTN